MDSVSQSCSLSNSELGLGPTLSGNPVSCKASQGHGDDTVEDTAKGTNTCPPGDNEGVPRKKSRKRNPENWKQNVRKTNKNKGLEYIRANGKISERKKLGPPCSCREKCFLKIGLKSCEKIFENFWKLGDHTLQNAYIAGCVRVYLPKHCYKKDGIPSRRFYSRDFHVTVDGVDTEVCKQAFLNMHAISNGRLDRLLKRKQEIGHAGVDNRGRHRTKVNKIPAEKVTLVRRHIDSVRRKAGYITTTTTTGRKSKVVEILPGNLNIRTMYRAYREELTCAGLDPVCEYRYRKIFHTDYHLDFGKSHRVVPEGPANPDGSDRASGMNLNIARLSVEPVPIEQDLNQAGDPGTNGVSPFALLGPHESFRYDYSNTQSCSTQDWIFTNPSIS